jgi:hypothetical protein
MSVIKRITGPTPLLLIFTACFLTSCLDVKDFGGYWERAGLDERLEGDWKRIAVGPEQTIEGGYGIGKISYVREKDGAYHARNEEDKDSDKNTMVFKTWGAAGPYDLLFFGPYNGMIVRYTLKENIAEICNVDGVSFLEFVQKNYGPVKNIKEDETGNPVIALLDKQVMEIISRIPNTNDYWICDQKYEKITQ